MNHLLIESEIKQWLQEVVIGLTLCPFAKAPFQKEAIRFFISEAQTEECLISDLVNECQILDGDSAIETTLLICPYVLSDFFVYNQFLPWADKVLKEYNWSGVYQIASFHPHYQFANIDKDDPQNLSNCSPYPILHLLRESTLSDILERYDNPEKIPEINIETMNKLSPNQKQQLFPYLFK
ncbi:MAG: DUF1415 domain-containing protein [Cellvibrionaceae bacterium]